MIYKHLSIETTCRKFEDFNPSYLLRYLLMNISIDSDAMPCTFRTFEFYENATAFAIGTSSSCDNVSNFFGFNPTSITIWARFALETKVCSASKTFRTYDLLIDSHFVDASFGSFFKRYCKDNIFSLVCSKCRMFVVGIIVL